MPINNKEPYFDYHTKKVQTCLVLAKYNTGADMVGFLKLLLGII